MRLRYAKRGPLRFTSHRDFARAFERGPDTAAPSFEQYAAAARIAHEEGLGVNAGHDLDLRNLPRLAREVPEITEASIGHAIIADALYLGLAETIRRYVAACRGDTVPAPTTH